MAYPFRNLVFEGGGVKGSAYIGAIRALNEEGILPEIQRFGDFSWSDYCITFRSFHSIRRSCKIHKDMNFKAFKDDDFSIVQDNIRLFLMVLVSIKGFLH